MSLTIGDGMAIASVAYLLRFAMQSWRNERAIKIVTDSVKAASAAYADKK